MTTAPSQPEDIEPQEETVPPGPSVTQQPPLPPESYTALPHDFFDLKPAPTKEKPQESTKTVSHADSPDSGLSHDAGSSPKNDGEEDHQINRYICSIAKVVGQACVEAEIGLRSIRQLSAWMDMSTYDKMNRRSQLALQSRKTTQERVMVHSISSRCHEARPDVFEASTSVLVGNRVRAVAMRIEKRRAKWKVTALELG